MDIITKWKSILFSPSAFFSKTAKEGYKEPMLFIIVLYFAYTILSIPIFAILFRQMAAELPFAGGMFAAILFISIIFGPILTLLFLLIWTAYLHLFAWLFGGNGYVHTLQAVAYSSAPTFPLSLIAQYLGIIPIAGPFLSLPINLAAMVYSIVLMIIGIRTLHRISTGRAVAAVLIPYALLFLIIMVIVVLVLFTVLSYLPNAPVAQFD
ncbi:YIP1 family protein [Candidatus Woesearchaeota archaeon]|nr:YIP1 family protein [Candidatus Woesearchaeota archaeon]